MKRDALFCGLMIVTLAAAVATSCGGGGGGGGGSNGPAVIMEITVQGVGAPIYANGQAPQAVCPNGVFLNSRVSITFNGPVDPSSIPADGPAQGGAIQVTNVADNVGARGVFTIDSADPRVVHFTALPPENQTAGCTAGFASGATYTVFIPDATAGSNAVITVGGQPVNQAVTTCFTIVNCPGGTPFVDPNTQPPAIISTTPATSPAAPMTTTGAIAASPTSSRITIDIDQPLDPTTVGPNSVQVFNLTANATNRIPVAGSVNFTQFGFVPGVSVARIEFVTSLTIADGDVFEVQFTGVADLGGQPLTVPTGSRLFTVANNNDNVADMVAETFDSTLTRATTSGEIDWTGNGVVSASFPIEIVGTGADGTVNFNASATINTDMTTLPTAGNPMTSEPGIYNATSLSIGNTSIGNFALSFSSTTDTPPGQSNSAIRLRSQNAVTILLAAVISCDGRAGLAGGSAPASGTSSRLGGWGGPGGGAGGISSPNQNNMESPFGNPGEGGHVDVLDDTMPGNATNTNSTSPLFGGGNGGAAGLAANFTVGAGGGGGGSASSFGGYTVSNPAPAPTFSFFTSVNGETHTGPGAPPAGSRGPFPAAMVPPLMDAIGGSGGGGGGDRVVTPGNVANEFPGGGGGGGGGAIRVTAGTNVTIGNSCSIRARGGVGGTVSGFFAGTGAGGSGGSIIVQCFGNISMGLGSTFTTAGAFGTGGNTPTAALNGEGGRGGDGVVQCQDGTGTFLTTLVSNSVICAGEFFIDGMGNPLTLGGGGGLSGVAESLPYDTGAPSVDYTSATSVQSNGTVSGALVTVTLTGIAEDPAAPGTPATAAMAADGTPLMVGPVSLANVSQLNGYRYFKISIATSYPPPPATTLTDILPSVDSVTVNYIR